MDQHGKSWKEEGGREGGRESAIIGSRARPLEYIYIYMCVCVCVQECGSSVEVPKDWVPPPPPDQSPEEKKMMEMVANMQKYMILMDFDNVQKAADLIKAEGNERWTRIVNNHLSMTKTVDAGGHIGKNIFKVTGMDAKQLNSALKYQMGNTFFDDSKKLIVVGSHALHSPRSRSGIPDFYKWQKGLNLPDVHFVLLTPEHGNHDLGREADQYSGRSLLIISDSRPPLKTCFPLFLCIGTPRNSPRAHAYIVFFLFKQA